MRRKIIERDNSTCRYCLAQIKDPAKVTIDHVIPYAKGGLTVEDNLVVACKGCQIRKGNKYLHQTKMKLWYRNDDI